MQDGTTPPAGTTGLPGLRGGDHIGLTVPDIEAATAFLVDVLGAEPVFDLGPVAAAADGLAARLGVDVSAWLHKVRMLRLGGGLNLELFQYAVGDQCCTPPRNSDIGGHHVALCVNDMDAAVSHLRARGVEVMGEPMQRRTGPTAGQSWVYFRCPWGLQMELVSYSTGNEGKAGGRLTEPSTSTSV